MSEDAQPSTDGAAAGPGPGVPGTEPLACVSCRSRKLKCDRTRPACARCLKVGTECVYPESRRKPAFKRRNVKELEARLAQVEVYLKEANRSNGLSAEEAAAAAAEDAASYRAYTFTDTDVAADQANDETDTAQRTRTSPDASFFTGQQTAPETASQADDYVGGSQLMGLGLTERLPPFELMEELNSLFFETAYHHIPVVHQGRYMRAFYSDPIRRPPMCLQYAIWACAAQRHEKYESYADVFYKRARHYFEADEMRGRGESFLSLAHAQFWVLIASYESKAMLFSRASMSVARGVRLINMLGLHRIDGPPDEMPPMIPPPATWAEKEERRRVFWGAFASDSHATIATGWPSLIQLHECSTKLPASEEAFRSDKEEETAFLEEAFNGASYAGFAGTIIFCHMFKLIMPHVHRPKPNDRPDDLMDGPFWIRHRELDNQLLSLFMFLPEQFRLPQHIREPVAIHTNLNLHASVICLHHAAIEMSTKYDLPQSLKQGSISRLRTAADEIANIIKMTVHNQSSFRSPLCALALYTATTAYVYVAKYQRSTLTPIDIANMETVMQAMEVIGRAHKITRAFLQQICLDVERHELTSVFKITNLLKYRELFGRPSSNIPLLARNPISAHTSHAGFVHSMGRNPTTDAEASQEALDQDCNNVGGNASTQPNADTITGEDEDVDGMRCFKPVMSVVNRNLQPPPPVPHLSHKRKRVSPSPTPDSVTDTVMIGVYPRHGRMAGYEQQPTLRGSTESWSVNGVSVYSQSSGAIAIPDRTNSTASSSPMNRNTGTEPLSGSSHTSPGMGLGNSAEENKVDLRQFIGRIPTPIWQATEETLFGQVDAVDFTGSGVNDPWENMHDNMYSNDNGMLR